MVHDDLHTTEVQYSTLQQEAQEESSFNKGNQYLYYDIALENLSLYMYLASKQYKSLALVLVTAMDTVHTRKLDLHHSMFHRPLIQCHNASS